MTVCSYSSLSKIPIFCEMKFKLFDFLNKQQENALKYFRHLLWLQIIYIFQMKDQLEGSRSMPSAI